VQSDRSHLNYIVADTERWEQSAAFYIDNDSHVVAFAKNFNLGFAIPYAHSGNAKEYLPDFLARPKYGDREIGTLILETKGYDLLMEVKETAAHPLTSRRR